MRRKIIFICVISLMILFMWVNGQSKEILTNDLLTYYKEHFYLDTGAQNAVTAIYLNYRVYDTLFEALLLLVSVIGIIYFSRHEGGKDHE